MSNEPMPTADAARPRDPLASLAAQLQQLQRTDRGSLARLRRFHPASDESAALFETERLLQRAGLDVQGPTRARWALVLHCLALAQGRHAAAARNRQTGEVLAALGLGESRLKQLLEADADTLADLMPRLARRIGAAGEALDWWPLAEMLLYTGTNEEGRADRARRRLVEGYLRSPAQGGQSPTR